MARRRSDAGRGIRCRGRGVPTGRGGGPRREGGSPLRAAHAGGEALRAESSSSPAGPGCRRCFRTFSDRGSSRRGRRSSFSRPRGASPFLAGARLPGWVDFDAATCTTAARISRAAVSSSGTTGTVLGSIPTPATGRRRRPGCDVRGISGAAFPGAGGAAAGRDPGLPVREQLERGFPDRPAPADREPGAGRRRVGPWLQARTGRGPLCRGPGNR